MIIGAYTTNTQKSDGPVFVRIRADLDAAVAAPRRR